MKAQVGLSRWSLLSSFRLHPSQFFLRRRSQVVRQRSAKPLFIGSIPIAASNTPNILNTYRPLSPHRVDIKGYVWREL